MAVAEPFARIDLSALAANAKLIGQRVKPRGVLAVVKWDGYGHGLVECSKVLSQCGVAGFGVSSPAEGIKLRKAGITEPILVMTDWVGKPMEDFLDWNLEAAATSWYKVEYLEAVSRKVGKSIPTHIKFDTGLGRVGILAKDAEASLEKISKMKSLKIAAIYSHLGFSGPQDLEKGKRQIEAFQKIISLAKKFEINPPWIHLANSAAAIAIADVPGNLVRTGIGLYGQPPSESVAEQLTLEPVMTLTGHVKAVRRLKSGMGFPSSHFWKAQRDGWGAEINLGYGACYPRSFVNKAKVLFRKKKRSLVGIISKDTSYVFTGSDKPEIGEEVVYWGKQGDEKLYLYELSGLIEALPYELPTWLSGKLHKEFI